MSELKVDPLMNKYCYEYVEYKLGLRKEKPVMEFDTSLKWYNMII